MKEKSMRFKGSLHSIVVFRTEKMQGSIRWMRTSKRMTPIFCRQLQMQLFYLHSNITAQSTSPM